MPSLTRSSISGHSAKDTRIPLILFGAFDRHNFGDMLFAHITERLIAEHAPARAVCFAGLAARDLRADGGHLVAALASLMTNSGDERIALLHIGGELFTCDAWEAAVMLASSDDAQALIATHGGNANDRTAWARTTLGIDVRAPYVIGRAMFPQAAWIGFTAIGGASLDARDDHMRTEVLSKLRAADDLSVRDANTQTTLNDAGIASRLAPDPASMIATLSGERIREHGRTEHLTRVREGFKNGYLAVQFSADFGDDTTLSPLAAQLDALDHGIVLFRAGAAPWHDDLDAYARLVRHMRRDDVTIFHSLNVWDICALIAHSAGFIGSSLHGRIVAMAYALPRVNLRHPHEAAAKWELAQMPGAVTIDSLRDALTEAISIDKRTLTHHATTLAEAYRADFARTLASMR